MVKTTGTSDEEALRRTAASKRQQAKNLEREAQQLERKAQTLRLPKIVFDGDGATLTLTQAQLHFIHTKAFALEHGNVGVERESRNLLVTAGDERWLINDEADVLCTEGFDPFDNDWKEK